jgi:hypothetical protein
LPSLAESEVNADGSSYIEEIITDVLPAGGTNKSQ